MRYFLIFILSIIMVGCHKEFKDAKTQEEKNSFFSSEEAKELIGFTLPPYDVDGYSISQFGGGEAMNVHLVFRDDNHLESSKNRMEFITSEFKKNLSAFDSINVPGGYNMYGYKNGYELYIETNGKVCYIRKLPFNKRKKP